MKLACLPDHIVIGCGASQAGRSSITGGSSEISIADGDRRQYICRPIARIILSYGEPVRII